MCCRRRRRLFLVAAQNSTHSLFHRFRAQESGADHLGPLLGVSRGGQLTRSVQFFPELRRCWRNPPLAVVGLPASLLCGCWMGVTLRFWRMPLGPSHEALIYGLPGDYGLQVETLSEGGLACSCAATVSGSS